VLKLTLLLLSNKAMLIWSVRNHLIGLCCIWTSNHNLLFCYTLFEFIGIKTSLLLCNTVASTRKCWKWSDQPAVYLVHADSQAWGPVTSKWALFVSYNWSSVSGSCVRTILNYLSWWLVKFWKNVSGLSVLISCCVLWLPQCFEHPKDD